MEALEHSCFFHQSFKLFFSISEIALQRYRHGLPKK